MLDQASQSLASVGRWLGRIPAWLFLALLTGVFLAKGTLVWRFELIDATSQVFPDEASFGSSNLIGIAVHRLVGGSATWYAAIAVAALAGATAVVWKLAAPNDRGPHANRIMVILAVSWPLLLADVAWLGNGFEFLPLFMALAVLSPKTITYSLASVLAALTHPEQAFFAFAGLAALSLAPEFRSLRPRGIFGLGVSGLAVIATSLWISGSGGQSRTTYFLDWFVDSAALFLRNAALIVYSGWGVWWLILLIALAGVGVRGRWLLLGTAILIPSLITATTIDGTRVFTGVSSAVGIAVVAWFGQQITQRKDSQENVDSTNTALLGLVTIAFLIMPNLQVAMWGEIPGPGDFWIDSLRIFLPQ